MRFSPLTERVAGKGVEAWAIHHAAVHWRDAGEDVILLTVGNPDQAPPAPLIEATVSALREHRTGYAPTIGYPWLREAIAARQARHTGQPCTADNVAVVPGAQGGLFAALQCLAGAGDEVIVLEPTYATYEAVVGATAARIVLAPLRSDRGFHPDIDRIAAAVTPRTRVLWSNTPHNPTGAVFTPEEIAGIAAICRRRDLWLLSDEVYEDLAFARPHLSAWSLPDMAERTVVVSSLSKSHALPAFRLGWVVGPPALTRHLTNLLLCMTYGSPAFIQAGALAAFTAELPEVEICAPIIGPGPSWSAASSLMRRIAGSFRRKAACSCCSTSAEPGSARSNLPSSCSTVNGLRSSPATVSARARPGICASR